MFYGLYLNVMILTGTLDAVRQNIKLSCDPDPLCFRCDKDLQYKEAVLTSISGKFGERDYKLAFGSSAFDFE
jgi:hypothetical protein